MKIRRSIRRRLALSAICLVLAVVAIIAGVAYREVRASAIASATHRLTGVSRQLTDLFAASALQNLAQANAHSADSALTRRLRASRGVDTAATAAATKALARVAVAAASVAAVELWTADGTRVLTTRDSVAPMPPADARALMSLVSGPHTAAIGWISTVGGVLSYPLIAAVRSNPTGLVLSSETVAPLGYVVQRRRVGNTAATTKLLTELIGSGAKLYIGNARGDIWTDLVAVTPSPKIDAAGIKGLRGVLQSPGDRGGGDLVGQ